MTEFQSGLDEPLSSLRAYFTELNKLDPSKRQFAVVALLAPKVGRVRLLKANGNALSTVAECAMTPGKEAGGFWSELSDAVGVPKSSLTSLSASPTYDVGEAALAPVSIDLIEDGSGSVSVSIGQEPPLEGESLAALREQDVMPLPPFTPPGASEGSFLSAAHAADLLGVAKSTVTRKIEKNEVIGFRTFTNALRIPEGQFEHGDVVAGIPQVLALFTEESSEGQMHADHKGAWDFLTTVVYPGDAAPRPIDRLKAGMRNRKSHEVVAELGRVKESLDYGDHI